jgi:hypothetical protein
VVIEDVPRAGRLVISADPEHRVVADLISQLQPLKLVFVRAENEFAKQSPAIVPQSDQHVGNQIAFVGIEQIRVDAGAVYPLGAEKEGKCLGGVVVLRPGRRAERAEDGQRWQPSQA